MTRFGTTAKRQRLALRLSLRDVAEAVGCSHVLIKSIETGRSEGSETVRQRIEQFLRERAVEVQKAMGVDAAHS